MTRLDQITQCSLHSLTGLARMKLGSPFRALANHIDEFREVARSRRILRQKDSWW